MKSGSAGHVGDDRPGLPGDQCTRGHIPGFQAQFPKTIKTTTGDIAQVQSS